MAFISHLSDRTVNAGEEKRERGRERESRDSKLIDYTVLKWSASQACKYVTNDSARGIDSRLCCGSGDGGRGDV